LASFDEVLYDTLLADPHRRFTFGAIWAIPAWAGPLKNGAQRYAYFEKFRNKILIHI
jgi:hypothetical protein